MNWVGCCYSFWMMRSQDDKMMSNSWCKCGQLTVIRDGVNLLIWMRKSMHYLETIHSKLMVAKLKMVHNDHLHHMQYKFEQVKPVNVLAVIRQCIEILDTQKELEHLRIQMKEEFQHIFSSIPHLNELPTDVFCCIKLKDAFKINQTWTVHCIVCTPSCFVHK